MHTQYQALGASAPLKLQPELATPAFQQALPLQRDKIQVAQGRAGLQHKRVQRLRCIHRLHTLCQRPAERLWHVRQPMAGGHPPLQFQQRQQLAIEPFQRASQVPGGLATRRHYQRLGQLGSVHAARPVGQAVRLVQQYCPASTGGGQVLGEVCGGAEHVVDIGNNDIHPGHQVQAELVGAYRVTPGNRSQRLAPQQWRLQRFLEGGGQTVVVAAGVGAILSVAGFSRRQAGLLPGREAERVATIARAHEALHGLLRGAAPTDTGRRKDHAVMAACTQSLEGGVQHGGGLADASGRLQQQLTGLVNALVHTLGKFALASPELRVGERQRRETGIAPQASLRHLCQPLAVAQEGILQEVIQLFATVILPQRVLLVRIQLQPGQLYRQPGQIFAGCNQGRIQPALGQMKTRNRRWDAGRVNAAGLDFLHQPLLAVVTIRTAGHHQRRQRCCTLPGELYGKLRAVAGWTATVDALVPLNSLLARGRRREAVVDVTAAVTEQRQLAHGHAVLSHQSTPPAPPSPVYPDPRRTAASAVGCAATGRPDLSPPPGNRRPGRRRGR